MTGTQQMAQFKPEFKKPSNTFEDLPAKLKKLEKTVGDSKNTICWFPTVTKENLQQAIAFFKKQEIPSNLMHYVHRPKDGPPVAIHILLHYAFKVLAGETPREFLEILLSNLKEKQNNKASKKTNPEKNLVNAVNFALLYLDHPWNFELDEIHYHDAMALILEICPASLAKKLHSSKRTALVSYFKSLITTSSDEQELEDIRKRIQACPLLNIPSTSDRFRFIFLNKSKHIPNRITKLLSLIKQRKETIEENEPSEELPENEEDLPDTREPTEQEFLIPAQEKPDAEEEVEESVTLQDESQLPEESTAASLAQLGPVSASFFQKPTSTLQEIIALLNANYAPGTKARIFWETRLTEFRTMVGSGELRDHQKQDYLNKLKTSIKETLPSAPPAMPAAEEEEEEEENEQDSQTSIVKLTVKKIQ